MSQTGLPPRIRSGDPAGHLQQTPERDRDWPPAPGPDGNDAVKKILGSVSGIARERPHDDPQGVGDGNRPGERAHDDGRAEAMETGKAHDRLLDVVLS